jgi:hypothetical protein
LLGIFIKANNGVITQSAHIAQSQYISSVKYPDKSNNWWTAVIHIAQSANRIHHSIQLVNITTLIL